MKNYSRQFVKERAITAIDRLLKNDLLLLQNDVNERSVSHKLAEYLQIVFQNLHVDCEHNRDLDLVKRLDLP